MFLVNPTNPHRQLPPPHCLATHPAAHPAAAWPAPWPAREPPAPSPPCCSCKPPRLAAHLAVDPRPGYPPRRPPLAPPTRLPPDTRRRPSSRFTTPPLATPAPPGTKLPRAQGQPQQAASIPALFEPHHSGRRQLPRSASPAPKRTRPPHPACAAAHEPPLPLPRRSSLLCPSPPARCCRQHLPHHATL
jgi:hypothetical protein